MSDWDPKVRFVPWPGALPRAKRLARVALVDIAFAYGERFEIATKSFIDEAGDDLKLWIDHHLHPAWVDYQHDARFVLVEKRRAPACPELVTPERVLPLRDTGLDTVLAHGDFDGCLSAAKLLLLGVEPYPGADEDARAIDAPGRGHRCSARGQRLADALAYASHAMDVRSYVGFLTRCLRSLVEGDAPGRESEGLALELDRFAEAERTRIAELMPELERATQPHPTLIVLELGRSLERSVKKALLQQLEARADVALIDENGFVTAASFHDPEPALNSLPGLEGGPSYAWGRTSLDHVIAAWIATHTDD